MSLYLQRLARPSLPPASLARPGRRSAQPGLAQPGVQEVEQVVEAGRPERPTAAAADRGLRPETAPSAGADSRVALTAYVTRWLAGPGGVHSQTTVPATSAAPTAATSVGGAARPATRATHDTRVDTALPLDRSVAPATSMRQDAVPSTVGALPSTPVPADPFAAGTQPAGEASTRVMPLAPQASPGSATATVPWPARSRESATPALATAPSRAARATPASRQVEVHIGSIALTVKVPPNASPATLLPARPVTAAAPGTAHPRAAAAEPLRFSPARHHLRWS